MQNEGLPHRAPDKLNVVFATETTTGTAAGKHPGPTIEEIKESMAEKIRLNAKERSAMTVAETVFDLVPHTKREYITRMLEEMAADERYADIKAVKTDSGRVYFFSKEYIEADEAVGKSRIEEVKVKIAEKIRGDSRERLALTPTGELYPLIPEPERYQIAAILNEMQADERYSDIRKVTTAKGSVFFHSNRHISGGYATLLSRGTAKNPCAAIVDSVRDESRIYPRPTNIRIFLQKEFDIAPGELERAIPEILRKEEFADIKMLVHPTTGGVYLYSNRYLVEALASSLVDWEEVGRDANP
jgi:hypothetical protein